MNWGLQTDRHLGEGSLRGVTVDISLRMVGLMPGLHWRISCSPGRIQLHQVRICLIGVAPSTPTSFLSRPAWK